MGAGWVPDEFCTEPGQKSRVNDDSAPHTPTPHGLSETGWGRCRATDNPCMSTRRPNNGQSAGERLCSVGIVFETKLECLVIRDHLHFPVTEFPFHDSDIIICHFLDVSGAARARLGRTIPARPSRVAVFVVSCRADRDSHEFLREDPETQTACSRPKLCRYGQSLHDEGLSL